MRGQLSEKSESKILERRNLNIAIVHQSALLYYLYQLHKHLHKVKNIRIRKDLLQSAPIKLYWKVNEILKYNDPNTILIFILSSLDAFYSFLLLSVSLGNMFFTDTGRKLSKMSQHGENSDRQSSM